MRHAAELASLDKNGRLRTRIAQAYPPPETHRLLARAHAKAMLQRGPAGGLVAPSTRLVARARQQLALDLEELDYLPPSFLQATGQVRPQMAAFEPPGPSRA